MSTVMYCFWVDKNKLFELRNKVAEFWKENNINFTHSYSFDFDKIIERSKDEENHVEFQLFDIFPEKWLVRILSSGYLILNNMEKFDEYLEPCFYDNRSDMDDDEIKNEKYAILLDELINLKEYYLIPVITKHDIIDHWWKHANIQKS